MQKLTFTQTQKELLTTLTKATTSPVRLVFRAQLLLDYASCNNKSTIGRKHHVGRDTIRRWCDRWAGAMASLAELETEHLAGRLTTARYGREVAALLADESRPGAPPTFTEEQRADIIALAAQKPGDEGIPITHWTTSTLRQAVLDKNIVASISRSRVGAFLKQSHVATSS